MNGEAANVVGMRFEADELFMRVVVEGTKLKVVGTGEEAVVACNELDTSYWNIGHLESLDDDASLVVPNVDGARVETSEKPWLGRVEIERLDTLGFSQELSLNIEKHRHGRQRWRRW